MTEQRKKSCYLGAPEVFSLGLICQAIARAFGEHACYLVGSCLERPDFRDVDVRLILGDLKWKTLFGDTNNGEVLTFWAVINTALSEYISKRTGLRIDFQIQSMTQANGKQHGDKPRHALGIFVDEAHEAKWAKLSWLDKETSNESATGENENGGSHAKI
jgi:hypothetical protein